MAWVCFGSAVISLPSLIFTKDSFGRLDLESDTISEPDDRLSDCATEESTRQ